MIQLALAAVAFAGGHLLLSHLLRERLIGRVGEGPYLGLYSLLAAVTLAWLILAYAAVPHTQFLWLPHVGIRHGMLSLMPLALWLIVASLMRRNPTMVGQSVGDAAAVADGIFAITRHPFLWGASLWATLHILANGDVASVLFFGSFLVLAVLGSLSIDARRRRTDPEFEAFAERTSNVPFVALAAGRARLSWAALGVLPVLVTLALYGVLLFAHPLLFGVVVLPG